jgi:integrase
MDTFEADLAAFIVWWCTGGRKVRSRSTVDEYVRHLRHWMRWQQAQPGEPTSIPTLRAARAYIAEVREHSAWNAYGATKSLKAWSRFLVVDGLADVDPLAGLPNLAQPEATRTPVAELDAIQAILDTCDSNSLEGSRDAAIISLLRCTGLRRGELIALEWSDIDFDNNVITLRSSTTKSGKRRVVAFDVITRRALKVYRRRVGQREMDRRRDLTSWTTRVWVSRNGILSATGLSQMLRRRSKIANVDLPSHAFRRSLAVRWLRGGGSEAHLMSVTGWSSSAMVRRYVSAVATQEAIKAQRGLLEAEHLAAQRQSRLRAV